MDANVVKEKAIRMGAEATLYYGHWFGKEVIFKYRIPKKYRIEELDQRIRTARTLNEARALVKVKIYGINVPQVYEIDISKATIVMQFIKGIKLKEILGTLDDSKKEKYFRILGMYAAILHKNGHIHGDITTSNVIVTPSEGLFLIDFGLHEFSDTVEDKSVDLHLLKRVLVSSHGKDYPLCFKSFLNGYREEYGEEKANECEQIVNNIAVIETRGRYVQKEDRL